MSPACRTKGAPPFVATSRMVRFCCSISRATADWLPPAALVAAMPSLAEASIGHELTADALVIGFAAAVRAYKAALAGG